MITRLLFIFTYDKLCPLVSALLRFTDCSEAYIHLRTEQSNL